jgi:hypothetical protein
MVAMATVIALLAGIGQTSVGHMILRKAGLFEEPSSYTSLAFRQPQSLPEQLGSKRANVDVSFVIQNASDTPRDYQWSVLVLQGGRTQRVAAGTAHVASQRGSSITRSVKIFCTRGQVRILVSLAHPAEYIDALTACWSHRN